MSHGRVDVVVDGITGLEHVAVLELHGLGTLGSQFTRDDDFATLGTVLHDVTEDTVACAAHSEAAQQLVAE